MATRQTFHTPSFGDEEFEILPSSSYDQTNANTELSSSSHPSTTNQSSQWQIRPAGEISSGSEFSNTYSIAMGDSGIVNKESNAVISNNEDRIQKLKKKRDINEPVKPVSAYALFFRDTQAAIKGENPDASFEQITKIVSSMWDALVPEHKNVYKKKAELAKKEYLKALSAYRANFLSKDDEINNSNIQNNEIISHKLTELSSSNSNINTLSAIQKNTMETNISPVVNTLIVSKRPPQESLGITNPNQSVAIANRRMSQMNNPTDIPVSQSNLVANESDNIVEPTEIQKCIREGCNNQAIVNPDWEDEYCSNECVIIHCRDVFSLWVQTNMSSENCPSA